MMKIYTKKGDKGTTGLIGGTRVSKKSNRIDTYGTIDELNSFIGLVRDLNTDKIIRNQLIEIQDRLFTIGSSLAADPKKSIMKLPSLVLEDITALENWIDEMNITLPEMRFFVLPGGHQAVSFCHVARCVCRKAERIVVELNDLEFVDPLVLSYLNRLSDYLFTLCRKLSQDFKVKEEIWKPRL
jgi:cob(I)alamin adenosyltransferase